MAKKRALKKVTKNAGTKKSVKKVYQPRDPAKMFQNTEYAVLGDVMELVYFNNDGHATLGDVRVELKGMLDALARLIDEFGEDMSLDDYNDVAEAEDEESSRQEEAARKESKRKR